MDVACLRVPRHGFPHPLRSAFAVSHDLDGLPLSEPSDVFQPVTLMGFGFRSGVLDQEVGRPLVPGRMESRAPLLLFPYKVEDHRDDLASNPSPANRRCMRKASAEQLLGKPDPHVSTFALT